jgi:DNA-binding response OmpR family regulator
MRPSVPKQASDIALAPRRGPVVILCSEEEVRDVVAYWFNCLPAATIVVTDGREADRILREQKCQLLVTDRILPPWPGLDTFRSLRDENPDLRIAYVDNGNIDDRILARVVGVTDLLQRPLRRQAIIEALVGKEASS